MMNKIVFCNHLYFNIWRLEQSEQSHNYLIDHFESHQLFHKGDTESLMAIKTS